MPKKILITVISILIILGICTTYLSIYGIKTDKFNNFINNKVKDFNSKLTLQTENVYIKLNLNERAININTKSANLIAEFNKIKDHFANKDEPVPGLDAINNVSDIKTLFTCKGSDGKTIDANNPDYCPEGKKGGNCYNYCGIKENSSKFEDKVFFVLYRFWRFYII